MASDLLDGAGVAELLDVTTRTVETWSYRRATTGFPEPDYRFSGVPVWRADRIKAWAKQTGRL